MYKPDPFAFLCSSAEIQARVIHQDRKTAANKHHYKEKIEEVAVANPQWEPVRTKKIIGVNLRDGRDMRQADKGHLDPRRRDQGRDDTAYPKHDGRTDPTGNDDLAGSGPHHAQGQMRSYLHRNKHRCLQRLLNGSWFKNNNLTLFHHTHGCNLVKAPPVIELAVEIRPVGIRKRWRNRANLSVDAVGARHNSISVPLPESSIPRAVAPQSICLHAPVYFSLRPTSTDQLKGGHLRHFFDRSRTGSRQVRSYSRAADQYSWSIEMRGSRDNHIGG